MSDELMRIQVNTNTSAAAGVPFGTVIGSLGMGSFPASPVPPAAKLSELSLRAELTGRNMEALRTMVAEEVRKALAIPAEVEEMRLALADVHDFLLRDCGEYEVDADWRRQRDELLCRAASLIVSKGG